MATFEDVVIEGSGSPGRTGGNGAPIADAVTSDGKPAPVARSRGRSMEDKPATGPLSHAIDNIPRNDPGKSTRVLPASVKEKIAALAKGARIDADEDDPDSDGDGDAPEVEAVDPDEPDDAAEPEKPAPSGTSTSPELVKERDELKALADRQRAIIEKLRAEASKAPPANDYETRLKRLDEAEETYVRGPVAAFKQWLAGTNGLDVDSDDFKQELTDFYIDLTSAVTSAEADSNHQAKRSSALIRREWDRSNKKRAADERQQKEPKPQASEERLTVATGQIAPIYKSIADSHPHLSAYAEELSGRSPETVVAELLLRGLETGDFDANEDMNEAVAKAAKLANEHFKRRWDALSAKAPSTAKPDAGTPPAADATVDRDKPRQTKGARVTNADASVAPAAPPATKPSEPAPRKFRDDDERKKFILRKHLGKR